MPELIFPTSGNEKFRNFRYSDNLSEVHHES